MTREGAYWAGIYLFSQLLRPSFFFLRSGSCTYVYAEKKELMMTERLQVLKEDVLEAHAGKGF